jgi:hypothetical protein
MSVIVLTLLPFCFSVKIRKRTAFVFHSPFAIRFINMFNVLFQPAKKPDPTPKEKGTKNGENQVQFKIIL